MIGLGPIRSSRLLAAGLLTALLLGTTLGVNPASARAADDGAAPQPQAAQPQTQTTAPQARTAPQAQSVPPTTAAPQTTAPQATTIAPQTQATTPPVVTWIRDEKHSISQPTVRRYDYSIAPGSRKTIAHGAPGERDTIVRYTQNGDGSVTQWIVASHVTRKPKPRIVAIGIDEKQAFAQLEAHGVMRMSQLAVSAMHMVATAYTANCAGCGGVTASGRPAGHGVVAVDPQIIPLGTHLYIPGYGAAVAGDTGAAIHGLRIDLGFDSLREAMLFGRRQITVYRLK